MSSELVKPSHVEAYFKSWVFSRSLAANVGSNLAGIMDVCLFGVLCAVGYRSLRQADLPSKAVLPSVLVCVCVFS